MPNFETRARRLEGHGPPKSDQGFIGDRYTDIDSGEAWAKRKTGWTNRTRLEVHPTMRQKGAWVAAAMAANKKFEQWVIESLDKEAKKRPLDFEPFPDTQ